MIGIGISLKHIRCHLSWTALGLVACAVIIFIQGCGDSPLKPWHTEELTEEFTADMADEIQTFDDYRKLEDRLFAQLEEKVYAHTETGPEYALVRYSAGSAADPQQRRPNWNRSFEFTTDNPAGVSNIEPLDLVWPRGVLSLSHVALPFAPDDRLYGQGPPGEKDALFLGQMAIQGERNLLKIPYGFLVRLRYNPFYAFLEKRVLEWFESP